MTLRKPPSLKSAGKQWIRSQFGSRRTPVLSESAQREGMQSLGKKFHSRGLDTVGLDRLLSERLGIEVKHWYAQKSRVMSSTSRMRAVKLKDGTKGWIRDNEKFISEKSVQDVLHSVDSTLAAQINGLSFEEAWKKMSPKERVKFAEMVDDFDWDTFWKDLYPANTSDLDAQTEMVLDLYYRLGLSMGM